MSRDTLRMDSLEQLSTWVYESLCEQNDLAVGAFEMTERRLSRGHRPCGVYFCVHGPRSVKLVAIWETDTNSILFYASSGERRMKLRLATSPRLSDVSVSGSV